MPKISRRMALAALGFPAIVRAQAARPSAEWGVQSGDPRLGLTSRGFQASSLVWSRTDRPSRLEVEWSTHEDLSQATRISGPAALPETGFTARLELSGLPTGAPIYYRARFVSLADGRTESEPLVGRLYTPPADRRSIKFAWSGDTCGQGFGINPDWSAVGSGSPKLDGMACYETVRASAPDFFLHSGDTIYADVPIPAELKLPDGSIWKNVVTEAKSRPAETLDDFRGAFQYNLMDRHVRRFNSEVPQIWQWDDHEVMNNWSPSTDLSHNDSYHVKSIQLLAARANRAFLEYAPMAWSAANMNRVYRYIPYGPLLDVFVVDMRSYRGGNSSNRQATEGADTAWFGAEQFQWIEDGLKRSQALWKVIACDMPLGVVVPDGTPADPRYEALANGDNGAPLGRELEFARLLSAMKKSGVRNVVWLTTDVHYTAAHYYDPAKAKFTDFDPFWEFVSGPIHSGTFGPNELDATFGPQLRFQKSAEGKGLMAPSAGMQFWGEVEIEGKSGAMTVRLKDLSGGTLFTQNIAPTRK